jgi:hypothetical protein
MKTRALILAGMLALTSLPAAARGSFHPHVSVGLGFAYPYYYAPFAYDPWFYPYGYWAYPARANRDDKAAANLYTYPQAGQDDAQVAQDRAECQGWATTQSGFDPETAKRRKVTDVTNYNRAFTACMVGRDYSVQ